VHSHRLASPALSRKSLKIIGLNGHQIIYLPWVPTSAGLVLAVTSYLAGFANILIIIRRELGFVIIILTQKKESNVTVTCF